MLRTKKEFILPVSKLALFIRVALALSLSGCTPLPNPDTTIRRAYDWYLQSLNAGRDPLERARVDLQPLATERFLTSLDNLRPDLENSALVDGKNFDIRLAIEEVNVQGNAANARVALAGRMIGRQILSVSLVKEGRNWKIDDVKVIETPE